MFYDIVKTKHKEGYLSPVVQLRHSDFFIIGIFDCFGFIWLSIAMLGVILGIVISLIMDFE